MKIDWIKICTQSAVIFFCFLILSCSENDKSELVVMSLNVRYDNPADAPNDWQSRLPLIIETINRQSPNLIGFQEVLKNQLDDLETLMPSYDYIGVARDDGRITGEFSPVFYMENRLRLLEQGTFWLSEKPGDTGSVGWDAALPRIVTWARFKDLEEQKEGELSEFYFLNTHFDHKGNKARLESARLILEFIKNVVQESQVVLCGDFNFTPDQDPYELITRGSEDFPGLKDACIGRKDEICRAEPTYNGFGKSQKNTRIDYIFTSKDWNVENYETLQIIEGGTFISDHYPVIAKIRPGEIH